MSLVGSAIVVSRVNILGMLDIGVRLREFRDIIGDLIEVWHDISGDPQTHWAPKFRNWNVVLLIHKSAKELHEASNELFKYRLLLIFSDLKVLGFFTELRKILIH